MTEGESRRLNGKEEKEKEKKTRTHSLARKSSKVEPYKRGNQTTSSITFHHITHHASQSLPSSVPDEQNHHLILYAWF